ncbi:DUF1501 domain-containing protein [Actibacterium sp. MT2.3-13A]|uniref:DUF1501 domain-containing protein n=1 Tax=Actibacterium sp. MT2.3-13A TaxID=2828332 RepID=UPI001BAC98D3|nr:DUF1501 domain-containing protein [Actibacterium sp. MT2.3-13A]
MASDLSRRGFLGRSFALGCSAAASPLLTPVTLASAPWDNRLVVIILRGAMDGLDVVQPYGDPVLAELRQKLPVGEAAGAHDLDGFFALHPGLGDLMPLWRAGELGFAHAVSTPYRDKRSHFDGQDLLEAGTGFTPGQPISHVGWLNRLLQAVPGIEAETAFAIGRETMRVLEGPAPVSSWWPDVRFELTPQTRQLLEMVSAQDPLFRAAVGQAAEISETLDLEASGAEAEEGMEGMAPTMQAKPGKAHVKVAEFAADRLRRDTRIAAFSITGWDTHGNQKAALKGPLAQLSETILTLRAGLGPDWGRTAVVAMTEFGRTAHENGTAGTDHGTGGAMLLAGGALKGGRVWADWPGLGPGDLYQGRDLMPTADVRAYAAAAMQGVFGLDRDVLESAVFPGLDMGGVGGLIR